MGAIVSLYIDEWVDVTDTDDVYARDDILITRGRRNERATVDPGVCTLTLRNVDGKYSNRNPLSPYYGLIGRNTPLRVRLPSTATPSIRSTSTTTGGPNTVTVNRPPGALVGDLLLVFCSCSAALLSDADQVPVGGVQLLTSVLRIGTVNNLGNGFLVTGVYARRITDDEPAAYTFRMGNVSTAVVSAIAIANPGYGFTLAADPYKAQGPGTAWPTLGLQPIKAGDLEFRWVAGYAAGDITGATWTPPAGYTELVDTLSSIHTGASLAYTSLPDGQRTDAELFTASTGAFTYMHGVTVLVSSDSPRFAGEVSEWPQRWNLAGTDAWVPIEAGGITRRLGRGARNVDSPIRRAALSAPTLPHVAAYWPGEEESRSTQVASGIGGPPMTVTGDVSFGSYDDFGGSAPLPTFGTGGSVTGTIPSTVDTTGAVYFRCLLALDPGLADGTVMIDLYTTGSARRWTLTYSTLNGGSLRLQGLNADGTSIADSAFVDFDATGKRFYLSIELDQTGSNISWLMDVTTLNSDNTISGALASGTFSSLTVGRCTRVVLGGAGAMSGCAFGHVGVANAQSWLFIDTADPYPFLTGHANEPAGIRFLRLCGENEIPARMVGDPQYTAPMGPQGIGTFLTLAQDCADGEQGILDEARDDLVLRLTALHALYNRAPVTLDYAAGHIGPPLEPTDDDQLIHNDVTVARTGGSSYRLALESGPLSIQPPPDGVGIYDRGTVDVNVAGDYQLPGIAGWRLSQGTWDEARYPQLATMISGDGSVATALVPAVADLDAGDVLAVTNPPPWLPPDDIGLAVQSYTERHTPQGISTITWVGSPAGPYQVGVYNDPTSRYEADTTALASGVTTTQLTWSVNVSPLWTSDQSNLPLDMLFAGERLLVGAIGAVLNANPWLLSDAVGWTGNNATIARSVAQRYHPDYGSLLITPDGVAAVGGANAATRVAVTAGSTYQASLWVWATNAMTVGPAVDWYTATVGGSLISTQIFTPTAVPAQTWTPISGTALAPAGAAGAVMRARHQGTPPAANTWYATAIVLIPANSYNTSPQTFTVARRSVNGVVKTHTAGTTGRLFRQARYAL